MGSDIIGYVNYYGIDTQLIQNDDKLLLRVIFAEHYREAIDELNFIARDGVVMKSFVGASINKRNCRKYLKTIFIEHFPIFDFVSGHDNGYICTYKDYDVYGKLDPDIDDRIIYSAIKNTESDDLNDEIKSDYVLYPHIDKIFEEIDWRVKRNEHKS